MAGPEGKILPFRPVMTARTEGNLARRQDYCPPPEPCPEQCTFDRDRTQELFKLAKTVYDRATELVQFVNQNRILAQQVGVETIGIEVSGMLEGEKLEQVVDSLRHDASMGKNTCLTEEGLGKLRKAEKLLAEANTNINMFMGHPASTGTFSLGQMTARAAQGSQTDPVIWIALAIVGVIGVAGIVAAIALTTSRRR